MTAISEPGGRGRRQLGNLLIHATAIGAVVVIALGFLLVSGYDVSQSVRALWRGAFGSVDALVSSTLVRAVPLTLLGIGIALAFRVGVFNIGGDGQFLAGAAVGAWAALQSAQVPGGGRIIIALIAGAIGGAFWGLLPALLRRRWRVFEVLSTLMMNFVATYAVSYLVRGPLQEPTHIYPQSATIPSNAHLPIVITGSRLHTGFFISIACAIAAWIWLSFHEGGLRARLTGANPVAAASAGRIDTGALTFRVFIVSAALCGIAGAVEVLGVTFALYENLSPGYGFTAIAVALLAGLHPLGVVASAVLLAALDAGAATMQREAGVPSVAAWVIQALLVLAVLTARAFAERGAGALRLARP